MIILYNFKLIYKTLNLKTIFFSNTRLFTSVFDIPINFWDNFAQQEYFCSKTGKVSTTIILHIRISLQSFAKNIGKFAQVEKNV